MNCCGPNWPDSLKNAGGGGSGHIANVKPWECFEGPCVSREVSVQVSSVFISEGNVSEDRASRVKNLSAYRHALLKAFLKNCAFKKQACPHCLKSSQPLRQEQCCKIFFRRVDATTSKKRSKPKAPGKTPKQRYSRLGLCSFTVVPWFCILTVYCSPEIKQCTASR